MAILLLLRPQRNQPANFSHTKHFQDAITTKSFSTGEYLVGVTLGIPVFTFGAPVMDEAGEVRGVLLTSIRLDRYEQLFKHTNLPQASFLSIIDHRNNVICTLSEESFPLDEPCDKLYQAIYSEVSFGIVNQTNPDGIEFTIAYSQLILLKPGKLTNEEWEIMHKHPVFAFDMLSSIGYLRQAMEIPYCHHEK